MKKQEEKFKIYVASSWRNQYYPDVIARLKSLDFADVYDFRNPPKKTAFSWRQIDLNSGDVLTALETSEVLKHPIAKAAFHSDLSALSRCDLCVLVLPSGRSASWEYGFATAKVGAGIVYQPTTCEPELMYSGSLFVWDLDQLAAEVRAKYVDHRRLLLLAERKEF